MSNLDPLFLDIFLDIQKCPFCPLRAVNFKHEMQNTKNRVVTIMLTKRIFSHKKL
jgi:hypothetical protein